MAAESRPLTREEMHALLARNHLGRVAYARLNQVHVEPLHYVYEGGWLYGRTSRDVQTDATLAGWWPVAFEVDEVDGPFEWRNVIVHGGFYTLTPDGGKVEREQYAKAVEIFRRLVPEIFTPDDPTPSRDVMFRIAVQEISGRASTSRRAR